MTRIEREDNMPNYKTKQTHVFDFILDQRKRECLQTILQVEGLFSLGSLGKEGGGGSRASPQVAAPGNFSVQMQWGQWTSSTSSSGCLWGLVLMLSSPQAPRQPLFLLPSTGSQCFSRANVTNWGWPSTTCRSNSALPVVFARGILWVSFPALTAICKCALICVLTGFSGQVVHPRQGSAVASQHLEQAWHTASAQYILSDQWTNFVVFRGRPISTPVPALSWQNSPTAWFPSVSFLLSHSLPLSFPPSPIHL